MAGSSHHSQPALAAPFFSQRGLGKGRNLGPWLQGKVRIINFIGIETSGLGVFYSDTDCGLGRVEMAHSHAPRDVTSSLLPRYCN